MAQWPLPPDLHSRIEGGPLCPFHEHSIGSKDGRVPRYDDSHACVRCVSALTEGRLTLDVHRIHKTYRRRFLEFWSFVEIRTKDPDECWPWHGQYHSRANSSYFPIPRHWNKGRQYSAPRVATWFTWGDIGRLPIKHICGDNNCCNPLHIRIKGVPHYFHNRHMQLVDLEFSSHKLIHETQSFLETTLEKDPKSFLRMEKSNKLWIDFRLNADGPIDPKLIANNQLLGSSNEIEEGEEG